jgi:hypothetical protein
MKGCIRCEHCIYFEECTPFDQLIDNDENNLCRNFIDINDCDTDDIGGEDKSIWKEMSYNRYLDNLFNYKKNMME